MFAFAKEREKKWSEINCDFLFNASFSCRGCHWWYGRKHIAVLTRSLSHKILLMWKMTEPSCVVTNKADFHLVFFRFLVQIHMDGREAVNKFRRFAWLCKKYNLYIISIDCFLILFFTFCKNNYSKLNQEIYFLIYVHIKDIYRSIKEPAE